MRSTGLQPWVDRDNLHVDNLSPEPSGLAITLTGLQTATDVSQKGVLGIRGLPFVSAAAVMHGTLGSARE